MKKRLILTMITVATLFTLTACKQADVVGKASITSFQAVLDTIPDKITEDDMNGGWSLSAPDDTARFIWSKDYSKSPIHDVMIETDAKPFIDAGLDVNKLPEGMYYEDKIMVGTKLGDDNLTYDGDATPIASYEKIVDLYRNSIDYHTALDHYGVSLSEGNVFEWAKDLTTNDKDIVFVLNPQIFLDAGVDPAKVEGWKYAEVEIVNKNGKKENVYKFLKPFNLK